MNQTIKNISTVALATASFLLLTGYDSCDPVIENNGFDLWCGDKLCSWELEKGEIAQVPTWHTGDYGVDMVGDTVAISQVRDIDQTNLSCLRFDLVAQIEPTATVNLELDFYADGSVEVTKQIPTSDFRKVSFLIRTPTVYDGILFRVTKTGSGRAVLAQIYADSDFGCSEPPPQTGPRPLGARCNDPSDCTSGLCVTDDVESGSFCSQCTASTDCLAGNVCGVAFGDSFLPGYRTCMPEASKVLGMRCDVSGECTSGICRGGVCSTCTGDEDCDGSECKRRQNTAQLGLWRAPYQCGPDGLGAAPGEPCLIGRDCTSGQCNGTSDLSVCELDGRVCASGGDCPDELYCVTVGTSGGTCQ